MINKITKNKIATLKAHFDDLKTSRGEVLPLLNEKEIPELVYNSNAIENSTLTLDDTEKIILEDKTPKNADLREVYEAKNLATIMDFLNAQDHYDLSEENILNLHKILLSNINNFIAGRFRNAGERVRIGTHIAPNPDKLPTMIDDIITGYNNDLETYFIEKIANFHIRFEYIHPFNDGNGRTGRLLINTMLKNLGYPPITIFAKNKESDYYPLFKKYQETREFDGKMTDLFADLLCESLNKRIAYMLDLDIVKLADYAKAQGESATALLNAARRQTIPAFREKGSWMIGLNEDGEINL